MIAIPRLSYALFRARPRVRVRLVTEFLRPLT